MLEERQEEATRNGREAPGIRCEFEQEDAFWPWAVVEVLRPSGIWLEEMPELTHRTFPCYRTREDRRNCAPPARSYAKKRERDGRRRKPSGFASRLRSRRSSRKMTIGRSGR
jgi:hypothetical protein